MSLKTKTIKISEFEIVITQFNAIQVLKLRAELVAIAKKELSNISLEQNQATSILQLIATLIYEIPVELIFKLFKNCSAVGLGGLNNEKNFNTVFENNVDGTIELAMEVLKFNGFFSLGILSALEKIPMIQPMAKALKELLPETLSQTTTN